MKFNFAYVKKNPVMFGTIFVVFGLLIYLLLNRSASSGDGSGSTSYVSTGPSDTQVAGQVALGQASLAAGVQTQQAAIAANAASEQYAMQLAAVKDTNAANIAALTVQGQNDLALGTLQAQVQLAGISADRDNTKANLDAQTSAIFAQLGTSLAMQQDNNATQAAIYRDANATSVENNRINAALSYNLSAQQADAFKMQAALGVIGGLKKGDRDNALISLGLGAPSSHGVITGPSNGSGFLQTQPPVMAM